MTTDRPRYGRLHQLLAPALLLSACAEPELATEARLARPLPASPVAAAIELGLTPLALDDRGTPRLVLASGVAPAPASTATESALAHLGRLSAAWGVAEAALPELRGIGEVPAPDATIARVRQSIDGLPVEDGELRVMLRGDGTLVAATGVLVSADAPREPARFPIDDAAAIARAVAHNFQRDFAAGSLSLKEQKSDGTRLIAGRAGTIDVQLARARQVWRDAGGTLIPAWIVEAYAGDARSSNGDAFRTVLTADGARVLSHESLVADAVYSYRVYAETTGEYHPLDGPIADYSPHPAGAPTGLFPSYIAPRFVTLDGLNHPAGRSAPDPWLASGSTETLGNNVEAYTDLNPPSGLSFGDFRATTSSPTVFDRTYDLNASPLASQAQQMASITSAFYGINWQHDFWYDAGFTEAAGNAQDNNFNRGGEDRDAIIAETQDNAPNSLNNANMTSPSDGLPPRMQIFVWVGKDQRSLTIQPANRTPMVGTALFGLFAFDASAPIVLAVDGTAPVNDGCTALTNGSEVAGKLVLVDRGACTYKTKALNIQNAGGLGMILAHDQAGAAVPTMAGDAAITTPITIGSLSVTFEEGAQIKAELAVGPVSGVAHRSAPLLDGGIDSTLLAHEFGHYLHHRLQSCGTRWCSAMSEGWGDFNALMLMIRSGDNYDGAYPLSIYATQNFSADPAYFGIRRAPYSVNPAINSLAYHHMSNDAALPTSHPFLPIGVNAEVHNAGEIWAQTLMEVYVALLKAGPTYTEARAKMAKYVVAGLLMSPKDATPIETRDALLAVASPADQELMLAAFARRGMGSCAITPARDSTTFVGIADGFEITGRAVPGAVGIAVRGCDGDDVLDAGEIAAISLPISNQGHRPLEDVRVSVTSTTPGISVASEPVAIGSLPPGTSKNAAVDVRLAKDVTGLVAGDFRVKIESSNGCEAELAVPFAVRLNTDDVAGTATTDAFDAKSIWKPSDAKIWTQIAESTLDRAWHANDVSGITDTKLESPAVTVGTGPFKVTFTHRYKFEYEGTPWDGGLIEYTKDGGATWQDVTTLSGVVPGYTHVLTTISSNPLGGRMAYANTNPAYPSTNNVTLDFGTQLAGMTVKLRFRLGTDLAASAPGWDIDDVVFDGITNKPFPVQVENRSQCTALPDDDSGCDAGPLRGSSVALALGGLALLLLRRRRRR